jgi:hypothetical protein
MKRVRKNGMIRLWAVSETPDENGMHDLILFDIDRRFNQAFEQERLDDKLEILTLSFFGYGFYNIYDEPYLSEFTKRYVRSMKGVGLKRKRLNMPDKINVNPDTMTIYLLFDGECERGCWVVAERCTA